MKLSARKKQDCCNSVEGKKNQICLRLLARFFLTVDKKTRK